MPTFAISLGLSKSFVLFYLILFVSSVSILFVSDIAGWIKLVLMLLSVVYMVSIFYQQSRFLVLHYDGAAWFFETRQDKIAIQMDGSSVITPWLLVLRFKRPGIFFLGTLVLFKDFSHRDSYRRCVVALKHGRSKSLNPSAFL